ncbi:MAG: tetratricopeptide repeat protein, partial [Flavisolibacter sp.]|nr:tetratricopeptide repeat protein [Flavisolibacter sp.]
KPPLLLDSLKKVLPSLHGSERVDCLNELARSYTEVQTVLHFDSGLALARQAYAEASAINYTKGLGDACLRLGVLSKWYLWNYVEMEKNCREAIFWYKKIQNDDGLGHAFRGLGSALLNQDSPDEAKQAFDQSAFHFRKTGNGVMLAELIEQVGDVYNQKGEFEKQFECLKQGMREKRRIGDNRGMIWSYSRFAHIYQSVGDYATALDYLRKSFQQARSQSIPWASYRSMGALFFDLKNYDSSFYYFQKMYKINPTHAAAIVGMGRILLLRKDYDKALKCFREALATFEKTNRLHEKTEVLVEIGKTYAGMKHYTEALRYAREGLAMARQMNAREILQNAYELHWKIYDERHRTDSAYFYYKQFVPLKDSLDNARLKLQHIQKLMLYKVEAKEEQQQARIDLLNKDNRIKQQQLQKEALQKKILVGSLAAFILISLILLRNITLKRKNEKHRRELAENELHIQKLENEKTKAEWRQQTTELEMQALRAQMNPHFIFNSLNSINRFILKNQGNEATEYLTKFSRLIRMILHSSANATVTLTEDIEALRLYLELESLRFEQEFAYQIQCDPDLDADFIQVPRYYCSLSLKMLSGTD